MTSIDIDGFVKIDLTVASEQQVDKYPAKQHARRVASALDVKHGLIYLPGQATRLLDDSDQPVPFRQLRYFYYLSGVDEPDAFVTYDISKDELTLYITLVTPQQAIWFGPGLTLKEAESLFDVDAVKNADDLQSDVSSWIESHAKTPIYLLHDSQKPKLDFSLVADPFVTGPLRYAMDASRVIKDEHEITLLRKANRIADLAHTAVLQNITKLTNEREVQAIFEEVSTAHGVTTQSYGVIAGSGPNGAVLHYWKNDEDFGERKTLLIDAGPDWKCYASDVTRTFPISGHWPSKEHAKIYDIVAEMQEEVIKRLKPGIRYHDMQDLATEIMVKRLQEIGIIKRNAGSVQEIIDSGAARIFFPHGLGHHVGLEVHDVSPRPINGVARTYFPHGSLGRHSHNGRHIGLEVQSKQHQRMDDNLTPPPFPAHISSVPAPNHLESHPLLTPNMVITVEPGIYFSSIAFDQLVSTNADLENIIDLAEAKKYIPLGGVRIEDDILITADGYENLTTAPKGEEALKIIRGEA